jgi:polar amino acid transport system substrate-binding protein
MTSKHLKERWHIAAAFILSLLFIAIIVTFFADDIVNNIHIEEIFYPNDDHLEKSMYFVGISDTDYPPLLIYDENTPIGFDIDLITWIAEEKEISITFVSIPWDHIFDALRDKNIDMITSGASITPERMEEFLFSDPYLSIEQQIAVTRDSSLTLKDFYTGEKTIGVEAGTTSEDIVHSLLIMSGIANQSRVHAVAGIAEGVRDLVNGELDYIVTDQPIMTALAQNYPLKIMGSISTGEEYGIVFRKDSIALQQTVNAGLRKLLQSSKWESLKSKYLINNVDRKIPLSH